MLLIAIDAFSKCLEVKIMHTTTTATTTVEAVCFLFMSHGLPDNLLMHGLPDIITDNRHQFVAAEFETFLKANGMKHTLKATVPSTIFNVTAKLQRKHFVSS